MTEIDAHLASGLSRRFRLIRQLGAGGMGAVYLAEQIAAGNRPGRRGRPRACPPRRHCRHREGTRPAPTTAAVRSNPDSAANRYRLLSSSIRYIEVTAAHL